MFARVLVGVSAWAMLAGMAPPPADLAEAFGARESVQQISLSPSGAKIAYVAAGAGRSSALYVVDLASGQTRTATRVDGTEQQLEWCRWTSEVRLLCSVYGLRKVQKDAFAASRLIAMNEDGSALIVLGERHGSEGRYYGGQVIDWSAAAGDKVLMMDWSTVTARPSAGLAVVEMDSRTGRSSVAEKPIPHAIDWLTDGRGDVRVQAVRSKRGATGMSAETIEYRYRQRGKKDWLSLVSFNDMTGEGTRIVAVDAASDAAFGLKKVDGRFAMHRVKLDGSGREEIIFAHPEVDVDGLLRIGRERRVVGATYATEARRAIYFDPELKRLSNSLSKALPGLPLVVILDSSVDESRLLIWAGSDVEPGRYYLYSKQDRQLREIMLARPQLESAKLATVKPIRFPARDGTMIPGYLTLPAEGNGRGLPAIVMPHGGPGARDEWGFDWLAQYFAGRGYAVLQPNFRGSAGYGEAWFQKNGFQSWRTAVGDVNDAAHWLAKEGIANRGKLAILGWSYGGYAALQSSVVEPDLFRAVVAIAPVTDLELLKESGRWTTGFRLLRTFIGSGPHVAQGSPAQNAKAIGAPVLMFHGDLDLNVGLTQSKVMADRLRDANKPVELVVYPGLDHQLEDSAARADMLRRSDAFLRTAMGL